MKCQNKNNIRKLPKAAHTESYVDNKPFLNGDGMVRWGFCWLVGVK